MEWNVKHLDDVFGKCPTPMGPRAMVFGIERVAAASAVASFRHRHDAARDGE
jgi:hypothetical protein